MNILGLDHAALLVQHVERSRQFYKTILGLHEIPSNGNCWLTNGNVQIHLLESPDLRTAANYSSDELRGGHTTHLAFQVNNLEDAQQHLQTHGVLVVCGPRPRWPHGEQLYFCDPDGYVIELFVQ